MTSGSGRAAALLALWFMTFSGAARADSAPGGTLFAAMAARDVTPRMAVPLGGYGGIDRRLPFTELAALLLHRGYGLNLSFRQAEGIHDPIRAKVLVLEKGGKHLVFIGLDVIGSSREMLDDIARRLAPLGIARDEIFLFATHTHSGPGAISRNLVWEAVAMDRFNRQTYDQMLRDCVEAVKDALARREPARLSSARFKAVDIQHNRRGHPGHFDPMANLLFVETAAAPGGASRFIGAVVNLAVHGVSLDSDNLYFSADAPGGIERAFERRLHALNGGAGQRPVVLFVNGAEGDVSPDESGFDGIKRLGERFTEQASAAMVARQPIPAEWDVHYADAELGKAKLNLKLCAPENLSKFVPGALRFPLKKWFPRSTRVALIELGGMWMMTWPGEPTTSLGLMLHEIARTRGVEHSWVLGLANDHLAYFTTPEEYGTEGGYEACASLYGKNNGMKVIETYRKMASRIAAQRGLR